MSKTLLFPGAFSIIGCILCSTVLGQTTSPSFDCSKAQGTVEELICKDESLAALDRKMATTYEKALANWPPDEVRTQKAMQRGWIKGRNDCWKADDLKSCVETEYKTRIAEMQVTSGQLMAPTPVDYSCQEAPDKRFVVTFYQETDPPTAVVTFGDEQVLTFLSPSGSGAKYNGRNVELWEHQGEASVDWSGTKLTCKAK